MREDDPQPIAPEVEFLWIAEQNHGGTSRFSFPPELPASIGNGVIKIVALSGSLNPVRSMYFCKTVFATFKTSASLKGHLPLSTTSRATPSIEALRSVRPVKHGFLRFDLRIDRLRQQRATTRVSNLLAV